MRPPSRYAINTRDLSQRDHASCLPLPFSMQDSRSDSFAIHLNPFLSSPHALAPHFGGMYTLAGSMPSSSANSRLRPMLSVRKSVFPSSSSSSSGSAELAVC